jgi:hypothetical protein
VKFEGKVRPVRDDLSGEVIRGGSQSTSYKNPFSHLSASIQRLMDARSIIGDRFMKYDLNSEGCELIRKPRGVLIHDLSGRQFCADGKNNRFFRSSFAE